MKKLLLLLLVLGSFSAHSFQLNNQEESPSEIITKCMKYPYCSTEKNSIKLLNESGTYFCMKYPHCSAKLSSKNKSIK